MREQETMTKTNKNAQQDVEKAILRKFSYCFLSAHKKRQYFFTRSLSSFFLLGVVLMGVEDEDE